MGRLIDADKLIAKIEEIYDGYMLSEDGGVVPKDFVEFLEEAPTVEAIPKAEVKKFLEEGTKGVGNNVLAIVREDYIHKADYENRLKADIVAMLTEIQLEIEELDSRAGYDGNGMPTYSTDYIRKKKINELIQQKIDSLKGE